MLLENFKTVTKYVDAKDANPQLNVMQRCHNTVKLSYFLLFIPSFCNYLIVDPYEAHRLTLILF